MNFKELQQEHYQAIVNSPVTKQLIQEIFSREQQPRQITCDGWNIKLKFKGFDTTIPIQPQLRYDAPVDIRDNRARGDYGNQFNEVYAFMDAVYQYSKTLENKEFDYKALKALDEFEMKWILEGEGVYIPNNNQFVSVSDENYQSHQTSGTKEKSWITYCILAIFMGSWGIHNFYAGQPKKALIKIVLTITLIGSPFAAVWGFVDAYRAYEIKRIPD